MTDPDILELSHQWQRDNVALEVSLRKARWQYWQNRLAFGGELLLTALALWGAWFFWNLDGAVFTVSAGVLLLAAVAGLRFSIRERMPLWHWHDWSPEGVLAYRIQRCESTLRVARSCKYSAAVLVAFLTYIWINADTLPEFFPRFYTGVVLVSVTLMLAWAHGQKRERTRELAQLRAMLDT